MDRPKQASADETSYLVSLSHYDTHSLCSDYTLRRHKYESEANAGCYEARQDWIKYVGPIEEFGGCNPINGNSSAVVLPLTKPERLRMIAYVLECTIPVPYGFPITEVVCLLNTDAFLYDNMIELEKPETSRADNQNKREWKNTNPALGKTQIQAKIMIQLAFIDHACTERVKSVWKEMIDTTLRDKNKCFTHLEEYVNFRMIDTGAPFVEAMLLFGMGVTLSKEEDIKLEQIRKPCYAALGLANDFFSFDREYADFEKSGKSQTLTNAVWLHMQWYNMDVNAAKSMTLEATKRYEEQFLGSCAEFRQNNAPIPEKLDRYLDALAYQISGNVVWSLNCPRYHREYRYDPNVGMEDGLTAESLQKTLCLEYDAYIRTEVKEERDESSRRSSTDSSLQASEDDSFTTRDDVSISSYTSVSPSTLKDDQILCNDLLGQENVQAPFDYITSLPSKGVRDTFIDALNIWLNVPETVVSRIKSLGNRLHAASLMLDDIEDGSNLRRGQPATHTVFGIAQTINSGCYEVLQAVSEAQELGAAEVKIVFEELAELHIGQSYDLFWTYHTQCPSENEYLEMVNKKTGGLFRLLVRLLLESADCELLRVTQGADIEELVSCIGIQYQVRDDYQNLHSPEYSAQKGFCEDLDEGKMSFPLVHALKSCEDNAELYELLRQRRDIGYLSDEQKKLVLGQLDRAGSMTYTRDTLRRLQGEIHAGLKRVEDVTGRENWILRALLQRLEV
ncbi:Fusicoccadiene synthase [Alternaria tenuissima]|uniref:geranylgeranyl diphosphate synthase n=1 Tax=Alternaria tenuissima TaxID=119927 RepID=A0AB37W9G2_9PLEO|nr:Fusicoccadiene synthase [Alternaria tenuissima]RYN96842.1 Fusicoccadiene synthase [Alternaria tenuissima]RYO11391.1 Fusicoccadiene synthase [Alternaria tenuissima]